MRKWADKKDVQKNDENGCIYNENIYICTVQGVLKLFKKRNFIGLISPCSG